MFEQQPVSAQEFEAATNELKSAEAAEELARLDLSYTTVRAPFGGRIVRRLVDVGQNVSAGTALFVVSDFDPLLAVVHVPFERVQEAPAESAGPARPRQQQGASRRADQAREPGDRPGERDHQGNDRDPVVPAGHPPRRLRGGEDRHRAPRVEHDHPEDRGLRGQGRSGGVRRGGHDRRAARRRGRIPGRRERGDPERRPERRTGRGQGTALAQTRRRDQGPQRRSRGVERAGIQAAAAAAKQPTEPPTKPPTRPAPPRPTRRRPPPPTR